VSVEDARRLSKRVLCAALEASAMGPEALARASGVSRAEARRYLDEGDERSIQLDKLVRLAAQAPSLFLALVDGLGALVAPPAPTASSLDAQLRLILASTGRVAEELTAAQAGEPLVLESVPGLRRTIRAAILRLRGLELLVDEMARSA